MLIQLTEKEESKTINIPSEYFLQMLNHFDPFIHNFPVWKNKIAWLATLNLFHQQVTDESFRSSGRYSSRG